MSGRLVVVGKVGGCQEGWWLSARLVDVRKGDGCREGWWLAASKHQGSINGSSTQHGLRFDEGRTKRSSNEAGRKRESINGKAAGSARFVVVGKVGGCPAATQHEGCVQASTGRLGVRHGGWMSGRLVIVGEVGGCREGWWLSARLVVVRKVGGCPQGWWLAASKHQGHVNGSTTQHELRFDEASTKRSSNEA